MRKYFYGILLILPFLFLDQVSARGGCFAAGTFINTPQGEVSIEKLHPGDRVIGYDFVTGHQETSTISEIDVYDRDASYLLNDTTRVTAEHPFYIFESGSVVVREVASLKIWDEMISEAGNRVRIRDLRKVPWHIQVYNLLNVEPTHNYYANGILVHNKGSGGGHSSGGGSSHSSSSTPKRPPTPAELAAIEVNRSAIDAKILIELANMRSWNLFVRIAGTVSMILLLIQHPDIGVVMIGLVIPLTIYLLVLLWTVPKSHRRPKAKETFTNSQEIIDFTTSIVPGFTNQYSSRYKDDMESWWQGKLKKEIPAEVYAPFSLPELVDIVTKTFIQYESDWTRKNWESMKEYLTPDYFQEQKDIFDDDFWDNFDINFNPQIDVIVPIESKHSAGLNWENLLSIVFQINAKMTNFEVSPKDGSVVSGINRRRSFTDCWTFTLDPLSNRWLLDGIEQM